MPLLMGTVDLQMSLLRMLILPFPDLCTSFEDSGQLRERRLRGQSWEL